MPSTSRPFLAENSFLNNFKFFYGYLGSSVFLAFAGNLAAAILDGFGLAMFIPLLGAVASAGEADTSLITLGNLSFLIEWTQSTGITLNLNSVLVFILILFSIKGVFRFAARYWIAILRQRFANTIRNNNLALLAGFKYGEYAKMDAGSVQNNFSQEITRVTFAFDQYFQVLQKCVVAFTYVLLAYLVNPGFAILVGVLGLLSSLVFNQLYRMTKDASTKITEEMHVFQGFLLQGVAQLKYLKATNLIAKYKAKVQKSSMAVERFEKQVGVVNAFAFAIREPFTVGIVVLAIYLQTSFFAGSMSELILSLLFFYRGLSNVVGVQNSYNSFLAYAGTLSNMERFIDQLEAGQEPAGGKQHLGLSSSIALKKVNFRFEDLEVLKDLDLVIPKNTSLGIVGPSGVGKTTLANILAGLYQPDSGEVVVDGTNLKDLDVRTYRKRVGYVTQESPIFSDSVFSNVSGWEPETTVSQGLVKSALTTANALDFVAGFPDGLQQNVGLNGIRLSGGQRQRLAIAREVYRDIDLLVLDEATSSLDSESEKILQENISKLAGSYTMVIIAHRLATIRQADQIICLEASGNYQIGTFAGLQESSPTFRNLVAAQAI